MTWAVVNSSYPGLNVPGDTEKSSLARFFLAIKNAVSGLQAGKLNVIGRLTLTASAASTTITDDRIRYSSTLVLMPETANAAAEIGAGTIYVPSTNRVNGSVAVTHANNAQTDRIFLVAIIG